MVTIVHVAVLGFIIVAGLAKAQPANMRPFAPYGARGIFSGAAYVYFTFTGFDAVATSAEEVRVLTGLRHLLQLSNVTHLCRFLFLVLMLTG